MADLNDAIQSAIRTLKTAGEIAKKAYDMFYNPNPLDIQTEVYDENGNLITSSIPNVAKWRDIVWKDAQSAMAKTFYVDQVNGSDNTGDGSANNPFANPDKAVNSIPSGGIGFVYLRAGQTFRLTKDIYIIGKTIIFLKWGTNTEPNPVITSSEFTASFQTSQGTVQGDGLYAFVVAGGTLAFARGVDIEIPSHTGTNVLHSTRRSLIVPLYNSAGPACIRAHYCKITLNKDFRLIDTYNYGGGNEGTFLQLWGVTIEVNDAGTPLIALSFASPLILGTTKVNIVDNTGTGKTLNQLIAGIVTDATTGQKLNLLGAL